MFYRSRKPRDRHTGLIGLAESDDGVQWLKADRPVLTPGMEEDRYGCEDPRVIQWRDSFLMTYTGVSERRGETFKTHICLAFSRDGLYWRKQPITLKPTFPYYTPFFKAAVILPWRYRDKWVMYFTGRLKDCQSAIGCAVSSDLTHWKEVADHPVLMPRKGYFDSWVVEVGTCILNEDGIWLFYNGRDHSSYRIGCALLAYDDPTRVLWRCERAILEPCLNWERLGITPEVTFLAGGVVRVDGKWALYYGAADTVVGVAMTEPSHNFVEPEIERWLSQTLRQFLARFPIPCHWDPSQWMEEVKIVAWAAAVEACQSFREDFGVPKELFVRQRVWNALKDYWRLEQAYGSQTASLDELFSDEKEGWQERLADERVKEAIDHCLFQDLLARLPERERVIIERLFWEKESLTAIAKDLKVSVPRVHQLKEKALARLRAWLQPPSLKNR